MLILPAIDLQSGKCVRLLRGDFESATQYGDPSDQLRRFADAGATWLHVVDLDGARSGAPSQHALIGRLARETPLNVQCGGGVRERADVAALLDAGVARVIVGSAAARRPAEVREWIAEFGAERVGVALDVAATARGWEVRVDGWTADSGRMLEGLLGEFPRDTLRHVLATDISRDGALSGANTLLMEELAARRRDIQFQASGGVARLADLRALREAGAAAAIVGRALYEQRFTLEDALAL